MQFQSEKFYFLTHLRDQARLRSFYFGPQHSTVRPKLGLDDPWVGTLTITAHRSTAVVMTNLPDALSV